MTTVSLTEARRRLTELAEAAERGESLIITKRGRPVARLRPIPSQEGRPLPDLADFRATIRATGKPLSQTVVDLRGSNRF